MKIWKQYSWSTQLTFSTHWIGKWHFVTFNTSVQPWPKYSSTHTGSLLSCLWMGRSCGRKRAPPREILWLCPCMPLPWSPSSTNSAVFRMSLRYGMQMILLLLLTFPSFTLGGTSSVTLALLLGRYYANTCKTWLVGAVSIQSTGIVEGHWFQDHLTWSPLSRGSLRVRGVQWRVCVLESLRVVRSTDQVGWHSHHSASCYLLCLCAQIHLSL